MDLRDIGSEVIVKLCSQCQEGIEFYCHSCQQDLCFQCKEKHVIDLDTKHHEVTIYRERFSYIPKQVYCQTHPKQVCKEYCKRCDIPVCFHCRKHKEHKAVDIRTAYEDKKEQLKEIIHNIRSDSIYNRTVLLVKLITVDLKKESDTCHKEFSNLLSEMVVKSQRFKHILDSALRKRALYNFFHTGFSVSITNILHSEHGYNQSAYNPVKFLRFIKKAEFSSIQESTNLAKDCWLPSLTQEMKKVFLCEIQIRKKGKRQAANYRLITMIPTPVFKKSIQTDRFSGDFTFVSTDLIWLRDRHNLILWDTTTGENIHCVEGSCDSGVTHTLNREGELIYVDKDNDINILQKNMQTKTHFVERTCFTPTNQYKPTCLYCSAFTGDLLVGMAIPDTYPNAGIGKVVRYNSSGQLTQTIQHDNTGQPLYGIPYIITENVNGDIAVADRKNKWELMEPQNNINRFVPQNKCYCTEPPITKHRRRYMYINPEEVARTNQIYNENCAPYYYPVVIQVISLRKGSVVVTDHKGKYRFEHTGRHLAEEFHVHGLCTDALSHILVNSKYVIYMLDKDGHFLTELLLRPSVLHYPKWLNYDFNNHLLLVSSGFLYGTSEVSGYRYINRHFDLRGMFHYKWNSIEYCIKYFLNDTFANTYHFLIKNYPSLNYLKLFIDT